MTAARFVHGTYSGEKAHRKRGEAPCDRCLEAAAEYMRVYRARTPEARRKDRYWRQTHWKALMRLEDEYPERFVEILAEVRAEVPHEW